MRGIDVTEAERILCGVLADLFAVPEVGPQDGFVRLGGDSIIAVQVVGAARRAGLRITVRDVLTLPDVAALAAAALPSARSVRPGDDGDGGGVGPVRPTPVMRWLDERGGPADRYYQYLVVRTPAGLTGQGAAEVLQAVLDRHDMLRVVRDGSGWRTRPAGSVRAGQCLRRVATEGREATPEEVAREVHAARDRLSVEGGVIVQAVWFDAGSGQPGALALVVNHVVVDGISWRVLTGDLGRAWEAVAAGRAPAGALDPVGTSFRRWSELLTAEAAGERAAAEAAYWSGVVRPGAGIAGRRPLDAARDHEDRAAHLALSLPAATAGPLLTSVADRLGADANEVLLTGLSLALARWRPCGPEVLVELEGHGREDIGAEADLSRTVGWFTTLFPTRFALAGLAAADAEDGGPTAAEALRRVREQLRAVPRKGIGYGLLRHLDPVTGGVLAAAEPAGIGFNYLGRLGGPGGGGDWQLLPAHGARLDAPGPGMPMAHAVEVSAFVLESADGPVLHADWAWADGVHDEAEVRALAEDWFRMLGALVVLADRTGPAAPSAAASGGPYTVSPAVPPASGLALDAIGQDELDDLAASLGLL
ncbi:condensation domain-containing protein [Streptomyces erythrochromogenes]|uniref:condensation domain-containing protein n=1 Tax=Streptomyces erythrochromogenes TaxID=285574 RepID=UPI0036A4AD0F